jgi:hypothetical protein
VWWVGDVFGNNNYQGGNNNSGDVYTASQFGLSAIMKVEGGRSSTGNYTASAFYPANSQNVNETQAPTSNNFQLHWYNSSGEVANNSNLANEPCRIAVWGKL